MKFTVASSTLKKALSKIAPAISTNPSLPILEDFLFELNGDFLNISATDLEVSAKTDLEVRGKESGRVAVPAKKMMEIVSKLGSIPMEFSSSEAFKIEIKAGKGKYSMSGEDAGDFPRMELDGESPVLEIQSGQLKRVVSAVLPCTSSDDLKQALCGVYVEIEKSKAKFTTTDAHRLASYGVEIETSGETAFIMPKKLAGIIQKNIPDNDTATVYETDGNIIVKAEGLVFSGRKIDARYPDYNAVIPTDNDKEVLISISSLKQSIDRVSLFGSDKTNAVTCEFGKGILKMAASDVDFGTASTEETTCSLTGEPITIGFNAKYLLEMTKLIDSVNVRIELSEPTRAAIMRPEEEMDGETFIGLLMPVMV